MSPAFRASQEQSSISDPQCHVGILDRLLDPRLGRAKHHESNQLLAIAGRLRGRGSFRETKTSAMLTKARRIFGPFRHTEMGRQADWLPDSAGETGTSCSCFSTISLPLLSAAS